MATIDQVSLDIQVVLGSTDMPVHQVLRLGRGAIIELDATEDDEVRILANNFPVATGIVVVQGNPMAVEVKDLLPRAPDARWPGHPRPSGSQRFKIAENAWLLYGPGRFVTWPAIRRRTVRPAFTPMRSWRNW